MAPTVHPIEVLQAVDEWNFHDEDFMHLLPRHRRSQGGGAKPPHPPN